MCIKKINRKLYSGTQIIISGKINDLQYISLSENADNVEFAYIRLGDYKILILPSYELINLNTLPTGIKKTIEIESLDNLRLKCFKVGDTYYSTEAQLYDATKDKDNPDN